MIEKLWFLNPLNSRVPFAIGVLMLIGYYLIRVPPAIWLIRNPIVWWWGYWWGN